VKQRTSSRQVGGEGADRVLYVVDVGQSDHFEQVLLFHIIYVHVCVCVCVCMGCFAYGDVKVHLKL
jgi:hypothetical protein